MTWGATNPTSKPQRMRRSRRKGGNLQADSITLNGLFAISVTRPGKYGNPYFPGCGIGFGGFDQNMRPVHWALETGTDMVRHFREYIRLMKRDQPQEFEAYIGPLRGKNIACWCKIGDPCHGDILLELANEQITEAA